ncbi:MAG: PhnD/SsuA/transferrin family substrate-binding protein [Actinomycetota bacterium]
MAVVSLPMYDWPEVSNAVDRFWIAVRSSLVELGIDAPVERRRPAESVAHWRDPGLLLSQTCGLPLQRHLRDDVAVIGTFDHHLPDTEPGDYHSVVIVPADHPATRIDELRGAVAAVNGTDSQSGHAALRFACRVNPAALSTGVESGSHRRSIEMIATQTADVAAIDAVSWALALTHDPHAGECRVIARTPPTAGLPLITARDNAALLPHLRAAIAHGLLNLDEADRSTLHLHGLVGRAAEDYAVLDERWRAANEAGVPKLV